MSPASLATKPLSIPLAKIDELFRPRQRVRRLRDDCREKELQPALDVGGLTDCLKAVVVLGAMGLKYELR